VLVKGVYKKILTKLLVKRSHELRANDSTDYGLPHIINNGFLNTRNS
jgi:hypothetical protein